jgi:hypothetical protein
MVVNVHPLSSAGELGWTGIAPAKAIERLRLEASRERVESGSEPIEGVASGEAAAEPEHHNAGKPAGTTNIQLWPLPSRTLKN